MKWKVSVVHADGSLEEEVFSEEEKANAKKLYETLCKIAIEENIKVYFYSVGKLLPFKRKDNGIES